ncbi:DJ-1/PfpI family protein [Streptomyces malaysiense]|nr:DJ-1/PfpI family protein [Streptomyces malaysiense]
MLLYPGLTALDLVGPQTPLSRFMEVHLVWKTLDPVLTDSGMTITPTTTLAECPEDLDVLFVPGGRGQAQHLDDMQVLAFLADRGSRARYVTSVCGGSLILGAAGLLRGYRAATHWTARHLLPAFGACNVDDRVVIDRNRITGGGVTAGLDFGLTLVSEMFGEQPAKETQLALEYDPLPPFDVGSPEKAGAELTTVVRDAMSDINDRTAALAEKLAAKGWGRSHDGPLAG